jgi:molybdate transport system permease protein
MAPRTAVGRAVSAIFGHPLAFSFAGLVVGSVIFSLPFAVQPIASGFRSIDLEIREEADLLCQDRFKILMRILLPLSRPSLLTAAVLAFTHTVGEFGVVLMIGGSIPGVTRTLSISIYDQVQDFAYAQANRTSLLLLSLSFVALLIVYGRRGRTGV